MKRTASPDRIINRPHPNIAFAIAMAASLAACGDGGTSTSPEATPQIKAAVAARTTAAVPATPPLVEDPRTGRLLPGRADALTVKRPPVAYAGECVVDFTDPAALQVTGPSLYFDRVYVPWYQQCGAWGYAYLRPLVMAHVHISFADADVLPCNTNAQAYPSRIGEDGTCEFVDIATEPRTYLTTHTDAEIVQLAAEKADHTQRTAFDLNQIRIPGTQPVRLCYKKRAQDLGGPWVVYGEDNGSAPGVWLCWNQLDPGTWDLSDWVWDVMEVKITGTPGLSVNFSLDDLHVGIL